MKTLFALLTIALIVVGFFAPLAWILAPIAALIAIGTAPSGKREDGKAKTGGLLGGLVDSIAVGMTMTDCPYCGNRVLKKAIKCQHCHETLHPEVKR